MEIPKPIQSCVKLYKPESDSQPILYNKEKDDHESGIIYEEFKKAVDYLKKNKAPGSDNISAEVWKKAGDETLLAIWKSQWPKDWCQTTYVTLQKKDPPENFENYRTIALISQASKVLLKIIYYRLQVLMAEQIPQEQAGFMKSRGT